MTRRPRSPIRPTAPPRTTARPASARTAPPPPLADDPPAARAARRDALAAVLGCPPTAIPDDTVRRLETLLDLLARWTRRINLVAPSTLTGPDRGWARHVLDSAQLHPLMPGTARRLVDLGSGAGFPGLVLAILGAPDAHLVESDRRKAAFLREAARATHTAVTLHAARLESVAPLAGDVVTARALAPLPDLLPLVLRHRAPDGLALLPKGRDVETELTACRDQWIMRLSSQPARGDPAGRILVIREIHRVATPR
ncbi:16S rRNA (guanine(527)-N(7))-methyltransferase RsmG [Roseospira visakhapatnamensis]|uniref:Ribosomal RNA small subunit methyltransferase G n=1 Tax=Roseospira visakhapatnamensis TaxID=390880 RepID=A0A7W6W817_9PROT|nr:16S rRNA (guanine(527)-N(7))-methyltransferase RsmG [Roseospira visakhapatnamensis]MBB4264515.1 16S rRNA (guanine527-N7)-methyltransferase [Roseospira visakhapatnamensis]